MLAHDGVRVGEVRSAQRRALAAHPHGQSVSLGGPRQRRVDVARRLVAASHAGDHQRRLEPFPQELHRQIDGALVNFRQRLVDQPHVLPAGPNQRVDVARRRQPQVIRLAALDQLVHALTA